MPHYEKMLGTNSRLLRNYAVAYHITKNGIYKRVSEETINHINKFLSDQENGGFYGSQDADEEFYLAKPAERKNKNNPYVDKTIYVDWNAMMISSYIKAGELLNGKKTAEFAIKTADFILKNFADRSLNFGYFAAMYAIAVDMLLNKDKVSEPELYSSVIGLHFN